MFRDNLVSIQKWASNYSYGCWALTEFNAMMNSSAKKWIKDLIKDCTWKRSGNDSIYLDFPDGDFIELEDDDFFATQQIVWDLLKEMKDDENESL